MTSLISQRNLNPYEFTDKLGEKIVIRLYDHRDRDKLIEMYEKFDPDDRCLGLPPITKECIERWVDYLIENGYNIVAEHNGRIVGHVALVPLGNGDAELDIFVLRQYQNRGIGSELMRYAVELGRELGFRGILAVTEPSNLRAKNLFRRFGFKTISSDFDECHMYLSLTSPSSRTKLQALSTS